MKPSPAAGAKFLLWDSSGKVRAAPPEERTESRRPEPWSVLLDRRRTHGLESEGGAKRPQVLAAFLVQGKKPESGLRFEPFPNHLRLGANLRAFPLQRHLALLADLRNSRTLNAAPLDAEDYNRDIRAGHASGWVHDG